ncbi:MAG: SUMF1/EgtB/PvdO family nonheme iron enzyme [Blastocatellia bacterium]
MPNARILCPRQPAFLLINLCAILWPTLSLGQATNAPAPFGKHTENINGVTLELVRIPKGIFIMGNDRSPNPEEKPAHQVSLKSFYMGQYEVTRGQWNIVADTLPRVNRVLAHKKIFTDFEETKPVDFMFWDDAVEFCDRLTKFTGRRYRLPSEAEWEYACRAGTITEYSFGDQVDYKLAHFKDITAAYSPSYWLLDVGKTGYSNAWGLFDMHGNVAEWCLDDEHPNYIGAPTDGSAWGLGGGCQRGGAYDWKEEWGRSSARLFWTRNLRIGEFGFRVVAEITPEMGADSVTATSAAHYQPQNLAPESLGSLFGSKLAAETKAATSLPLPTTLAGSSVFIKDFLGNEHLANLLYVSPTQINFQMPTYIPVGIGQIFVVTNGNILASGAINIVNTSPGLFSADSTGMGLAAAVVQRVKSNGEQRYEPVAQFDAATNQFVALPITISSDSENVFLLLFGTGIRGRDSKNNVTAKIGERTLPVIYAGAQGFYAGVDQLNIFLPRTLPESGVVPIEVYVDGLSTNQVNVLIK